MGNILKIYHLKDEALIDLYNRLDKDLRPMPKKSDRSIDPYGLGLEDNDVDALRHAYISGVYTMEYSEETAELMGRLNELTSFDSSSTSAVSENMDLWNNAVGRTFGKKSKTWDELYLSLMKALKDNQLIIDLKDDRKYKGDKKIKRMPKFFVIKIKENKTGANTEFLDVRKKIVMTKIDFIAAIRQGKYPGYAIKKHSSGEFPYSTRDKFSFNNLG
ncbi:MAG: hypothetical protein JNM93_05315 [Bacteriovoracaceae bacterium]|nr:hypothetical protein [Bacteriovoracaceae bacterium]